jgi:hypothetical protein
VRAVPAAAENPVSARYAAGEAAFSVAGEVLRDLLRDGFACFLLVVVFAAAVLKAHRGLTATERETPQETEICWG